MPRRGCRAGRPRPGRGPGPHARRRTCRHRSDRTRRPAERPRAAPTRALTRWARPWKSGASATWYAASPLNGHAPSAAGSAAAGGGCARGRSSAGILREDRRLHLPQRRARARAQLLGEHGPRPAGGGERVGLPAGAVQGQQEQPPPVLPQRLLRHPPLEVGQHLGMAAELQAGLQQPGERTGPHLQQPAPLGLGEGGVRPVGVGVAVPQRQRRGEVALGLSEVARGEAGVPPCGAVGDEQRVDVRGADREGVAGSPSHHVAAGGARRPARFEGAAQPDDVRLERLARRRGWVAVPQRLRQQVGAHASRGPRRSGRRGAAVPWRPAARRARRRRSPPPAVRGPRCASRDGSRRAARQQAFACPGPGGRGAPRLASPLVTQPPSDPLALADSAARELTAAVGGGHDVAVVMGSGWAPAADAFGSVSGSVPSATCPASLPRPPSATAARSARCRWAAGRCCSSSAAPTSTRAAASSRWSTASGRRPRRGCAPSSSPTPPAACAPTTGSARP